MALLDHLNEIGVNAARLAEVLVVSNCRPKAVHIDLIDIVNVRIDVPDSALYERIMGLDGYERADGTTRALIDQRQQASRGLPLVVPEMIKTVDTMELMEGFYDGWLAKSGAAVIRGYDDFAGQLDDLAVSSMEPPDRRPCRRIFSRMTIFADGTVPACEEDFRGTCPVGNIADDTIVDIWRSTAFGELRDAHLMSRYDRHPLCPKCTQWHRP